MLHFEHPEYLWLLLSIPLLAALFFAVSRQIQQQRASFGALLGLERLAPSLSIKKRPLKFALVLVAFASLIIGIANPRMGNKTQTVKRSGVDVYIALDVSRSMWAEDIKPNRMERARQFAQKLVEAMRGDRIGLIFFAGQAYLQMPLTVDYAAASMFVRTADPDLYITQGTAIKEAIDYIVNLNAKSEQQKQQALVVITDGENHESEAVNSAKIAKEKGLTTYIVGAGTEAGAPIPITEMGRNQYKLDENGQVVQSKMNLDMLKQIATAGGGRVLDINYPEKALALLQNDLSKLEKSEFEQHNFDVFETYYQYFVAFAILLLIAEFMISFRRSNWLKE